MLTPIHEPFRSGDVTESIYQNLENTQPTFWMWKLWPLTVMVGTLKSGSKNFQIEFRPFMKFAISVNFFWKSMKE